MKKLIHVIKIAPIIQNATKETLKLSEKTIVTSEKTSNFFADVADVSLFIRRIVKESFSRTLKGKNSSTRVIKSDKKPFTIGTVSFRKKI